MIIKPSMPDYGTLSVERLEAFELQLGTRLPEDYRRFLLEHNGGEPKPECFWSPGSTVHDWVNVFYSIDENLTQPSRGSRYNAVAAALMETRHYRPTDALPIALVSEDDTLFLRISGDRRGCVDLKVLLNSDHFEVDIDKQDPESGMMPIAKSFDEFLTLLQDGD